MQLMIAAEPIPLSTDRNGVVRVSKTRVTLDTLVHAYRDGLTVEEIAEQYPAVRLADLYAAIGYYLQHQVEVDAYLGKRSRMAKQVRKENEKRSAPSGIRSRLLRRRERKGK